MPIHDWTRVAAGTWHAFHVSWIGELQRALNRGLLPPDYYALAEQVTGPFGPDVLALEFSDPEMTRSSTSSDWGTAVAEAPPQTRLTGQSKTYLEKARRIGVRHTSGDKLIALLELVSPGNKASQSNFQQFLDKAYETIRRGLHLLVIDLFPPTRRDPEGVHAAIWRELGEVPDPNPADEPLTLAAYSSGYPTTCYVEPTAVGKALIDMPLFLTQDRYVNVPLERTYEAAFDAMPTHIQKIVSN